MLLQLRHASIHAQLGADHIRGLVGQQESDVARDLTHLAETAQRHHRGEACCHCVLNLGGVAQLVKDGCVNGSRVDGVHSDLARQEVSGEGSGEGHDGSLGGGVHTAARKAQVRSHRAVDDNGGPVAQHWQQLLDGEVSTLDVGVEDLIELGLFHGINGVKLGDARIHEQSIFLGNKISIRKR